MASTYIKCGQCGREYTITESRLIPIVLGLGDYIALLTHYTGIAWLVKRLTRGKCGCTGRQEKLNGIGYRLWAWFARLIRRAR